MIIGGKHFNTTAANVTVNPANHKQVIAHTAQASEEDVRQAIAAALEAKEAWEDMSLDSRSAIFLRAAELISGKYRNRLLAATILGQGKNIYQAEIDAAAELIDFLRFNCKFAHELYAQQPISTDKGIWNRAEYLALDGFVYAVTPFNFTAIAGNLVAAPVLMGNTVIWKPSPFAVLSNYILYNIFVEAGLPHGVINFLPGDAEVVTNEVLKSPQFAGLHFTGSTVVFQSLYAKIGSNISRYRTFPRIVGETGGKNFHLVHSSADVESAARATVRASFEYQGQKCSANSRVYVPVSIWDSFKDVLVRETKQLSIGNPDEMHPFIGPVIHETSFKKLKALLKDLAKDGTVEIIQGGTTDDSKGYYVHPTIAVATEPSHYIFSREFFGPLLSVYVYPDDNFEEMIGIIDRSSEYALTGSVFAKQRTAIDLVAKKMRHSAGNFYVNDKCTGAVVGQQWFGGARKSGTCDKSGSGNILPRFVNIRNLKETFAETTSVFYPSNMT